MELECKACGSESPAEQFGSNTYYHRCRYCGFTAVVTLKEETTK